MGCSKEESFEHAEIFLFVLNGSTVNASFGPNLTCVSKGMEEEWMMYTDNRGHILDLTWITAMLKVKNMITVVNTIMQLAKDQRRERFRVTLFKFMGALCLNFSRVVARIRAYQYRTARTYDTFDLPLLA